MSLPFLPKAQTSPEAGCYHTLGFEPPFVSNGLVAYKILLYFISTVLYWALIYHLMFLKLIKTKFKTICHYWSGTRGYLDQTGAQILRCA